MSAYDCEKCGAGPGFCTCPKTAWVLLYEVNDYNQHGEYFAEVFVDKPSRDRLSAALLDHGAYLGQACFDSLVDHVLTGGGRRGAEGQWWHLREVAAE